MLHLFRKLTKFIKVQKMYSKYEHPFFQKVFNSITHVHLWLQLKVCCKVETKSLLQGIREDLVAVSQSLSHKIPAWNGFLTRCFKTKCIVLSHEPPSILYLLCSSPLVNCFTTRYKFVPGKSLKEEKPFFRPKKTVTELQSKDKVFKDHRYYTKGRN